MARALKRRVQNTLEAQLVAAQRGDRLLEHVLGRARARARLNTRHIELLPLNWHIVGLENGLDALGHLGSDTVTGDEGDGVLAAVLGRLEDVALDGRVRSSGERGLVLLSGGAQEALCEERREEQLVSFLVYLLVFLSLWDSLVVRKGDES